MGAGREMKNIWRRLFGRFPSGRWMGHDLFTRRWWHYRENIWHDSFGVYISRFVFCPLLGHRHVRNVNSDMPAEDEDWYCFNCQRHNVATPPRTGR